MGTAESAKSPTLATNAAGASATPEQYSPKNQRTTRTPGAENSTRVATSKAPGSVANGSLNGKRAAKARIPASTTPTSNHLTVKRPLPTIPPSGQGRQIQSLLGWQRHDGTAPAHTPTPSTTRGFPPARA